jgi:hypothetical protein
MFSFYTSTIPEIPNSHISDDPLDSQTIILKPFLQKGASRILTPHKLCEQNAQHENKEEISRKHSELCNRKYLSELCVTG